MTPGDRPDLPLAEEPALGVRAPLTGTGALGGVQPVRGPFPLEEEPATWPSVSGTVAAPLPSSAPAARGSGPASSSSRRLPSTGVAGGPAGVGLLLLAAGLALRARRMAS